MKDCEKILDMLNQYVDGELSESDALFVARHAEECESCRLELLDLQKMRLLFNDTSVDVPYDLRDAVIKKISPRKIITKRRVFAASGLAAAAVFALLLSSPLISMMLNGGMVAKDMVMAPEAVNRAPTDIFYDAVDNGLLDKAEADMESPQTDAVESASTLAYTVVFKDGRRSVMSLNETEQTAIIDGKRYTVKMSGDTLILYCNNKEITLYFDTNALLYKEKVTDVG